MIKFLEYLYNNAAVLQKFLRPTGNYLSGESCNMIFSILLSLYIQFCIHVI